MFCSKQRISIIEISDFINLIYNLTFNFDNPFSIDSLKDISFNTVSLLKKSGFLSIKDLIVSGPMEVSSLSGVDIDESYIIYNQALAI